MPKYFLDRLKKERPDIVDLLQYRRDFVKDTTRSDMDLLVVESWVKNYMRKNNVSFENAIDEYYRTIIQSIQYSDDFAQKFYDFQHKKGKL